MKVFGYAWWTYPVSLLCWMLIIFCSGYVFHGAVDLIHGAVNLFVAGWKLYQ